MKALHCVFFILLIIGGLNWLLMGVFQWEVGMIFGGSAAIISRIIYILVGLAAVYEVVIHGKVCCLCSGGKCVCQVQPAEAPKQQ